MDLVKAATGQALALFAPETNLGTWVFSSNLAGSRDWAESVPIGPTNARLPNGKLRRQVLAESLAGLQATNGDTGLYDTTLAAFRALQRNYAPQRINIVVLLTDGINDDPTGGLSRAELLQRLKAEQQKDKQVRIITVAYGANADVASLKLISQVTGGLAYVSRDPRDILRVFTDAITKLPAN
jgi:Ca-activated chloride channel homolog